MTALCSTNLQLFSGQQHIVLLVSKENDLSGEFRKCSTSRKFTVKGCQIKKFCEAGKLSILKWWLYHKLFDKSYIDAGKFKIPKTTR